MGPSVTSTSARSTGAAYSGRCKTLRTSPASRVDREAGTIVWPNGVDMAPEPLYAEARRHLARSDQSAQTNRCSVAQRVNS